MSVPFGGAFYIDKIRHSLKTTLCILISLSYANVVSAGDNGNLLSLWYFENAKSKIYLLGSIHAMKSEMYPLPAPMLDAFEKADTVVFEVDLTRLNPRDMSLLLQQRGTYHAPETIEKDLQPETMRLLRRYLDETGLSFKSVEYFKPWYLTLIIGLEQLKSLGYRSSLGIDQYLQQKAVDEHKQILELESFAEQVDFLSSDSMKIQDLALRAALTDRPSLEQDLNSLVTAWRNGDADGMLALTTSSTSKFPELSVKLDTLIDGRNLTMVDKIRKYADTSGTYLVVVGALHMGGEIGIIQSLARNFDLVQISD